MESSQHVTYTQYPLLNNNEVMMCSVEPCAEMDCPEGRPSRGTPMKICVSYPVDVCYVQPCFSATWETVNPFDKSVFISFANDGILGKWSDKVLCGTLRIEQKRKSSSSVKLVFSRDDSFLTFIKSSSGRWSSLFIPRLLSL